MDHSEVRPARVGQVWEITPQARPNPTQVTHEEFAAAREGTVEHHIIRGKLLALNQVIEFFRSVDEKGLATREVESARVATHP